MFFNEQIAVYNNIEDIDQSSQSAKWVKISHINQLLNLQGSRSIVLRTNGSK